MSNMTRPVVATTLEGKKIFFPSMSMAAECASLSPGSIHNGIRRGIKIGGWRWEYYNKKTDYIFSTLTPSLLAELYKPCTPKKYLNKEEPDKPKKIDLCKEDRMILEREENERESLKEVPGAVYRYGYFLEGMAHCICPNCKMHVSERKAAHIETCCEGKELKRLPGGVLRLRIK